MIDHVGIKSAKYEEAKAFYAACLKPLGYGIALDFPGAAVGFGPALTKAPEAMDTCLAPFWIMPLPAEASPALGMHFAFKAETREQVEEFYEAALLAGGKDNGAPGLRPQYHANYYGAFIIDLDGNNIEAVCYKN